MKRQDEELWMKKMKESLKDYSEPPAPDGWNRLEKELSPVVEKKIRPYTWWAVAATVLLAVIGASLFFMQTPTADDIRHISTAKQTVILDIIPETDIIPKTVKPESKQMAQNISSVGTTSYGKPSVKSQKADNVAAIIEQEGDKVANQNENPVVIHNGDQPLKEGHQESDKAKDVTDKPSTDQSKTNTPDDRRIVRPSGKDKLHLPVTSGKERSSKGNWSLAASVSNAAGTTVSESQDYMSMANVWASPSASSDGLANGMVSIKDNELVFDGGIPYLKQSATISEIKHKQPISFGLSVRRNLSNGFSVESGVTYTMLSSEGKSTINTSQKIEQKLHYIGIPLRGNWDFVQSKRFNVYLTAGGMIEKCVYGKIGTEKHTVKPLQFSLAGGVGGQLNISNRIGLYVEPGVSYFFDDGSDVETIRKENKLNFNLQAGIRFTY